MEDDWYFNEIVRTYKWANGFKESKQNRFQKWLGNGVNHGIVWMLFGPGFLSAIAVMIIFCFFFHQSRAISLDDNIFGICVLVIMFGLGGVIEFISSIERDRTYYNEEIEERRQLNMFRDLICGYIKTN